MKEHHAEARERMVQGQQGLSDTGDTEAGIQVGCRETRLISFLGQQPVQPNISDPEPVLGKGKLESGQWTKD